MFFRVSGLALTATNLAGVKDITLTFWQPCVLPFRRTRRTLTVALELTVVNHL